MAEYYKKLLEISYKMMIDVYNKRSPPQNQKPDWLACDDSDLNEIY